MGARAVARGAWAVVALALAACEAKAPPRAVDPPEAVPFVNVARPTALVGDATCATCHAAAAQAWHATPMGRSLELPAPAAMAKNGTTAPIVHAPTGYHYSVVKDGDRWVQVESLPPQDGRAAWTRRVPMDVAVGSGRVGRTYFARFGTRYVQLPLTWYADHGWDLSPGYAQDNPRFDRLLPERCVDCHASRPTPVPAVEGAFSALRTGIGCERCHGPGAAHVARWQGRGAPTAADTAHDSTIVNPRRLPAVRQQAVCAQCHVHTALGQPREGRGAFDFQPGQSLDRQWAFFRPTGRPDVVSHPERLQASRCFLATQGTSRPMTCTTCHAPHPAGGKPVDRNASCQSCHAAGAATPVRSASHPTGADCVSCHMPRVPQRDVHGTFTDHFIRVAGRTPEGLPPVPVRLGLEAYFPRDQASTPASAVAAASAAVLQATLTSDPRGLAVAADSLAAALAAAPGYADAEFLLGATRASLGKHAEAIEAFRRSLTVVPGRPEAMRGLAVSLRLSGKDKSAADTLLRRAIALQPAAAWIRMDLAQALLADGAAPAAARELETAAIEEPQRAATWALLALARWQARAPAADIEGAAQRAIALDPTLAPSLAQVVVVTRGKPGATQVALAPLTRAAVAQPASPTVKVAVADPAHLAFAEQPAGAFVLVRRPDGQLLGAIPTGAGGTVSWDLKLSGGQGLPDGLYRVEVPRRGPSSATPALAPSAWLAVVSAPVGGGQ